MANDNDELDALRGDVAGAKDNPRVAELRAEISDIVKLAHSGDADDAARYRELQPQLRDLTAKLIEAERGDLADATIEKVGAEWKIRSGKNLLEWSFGDREIVNYNRQNVDTNLTGGRTGSDAGGSSGGQYGEAHESAAVTQLKAKIAGITRLAKRTNAHTSLVKANCAA